MHMLDASSCAGQASTAICCAGRAVRGICGCEHAAPAPVWGWFRALCGSLGMSLRTFGVVSDEKRLLSEQKGGIWGDLSELNTQLVENKIEFRRRNPQICRIHPNLSKFDHFRIFCTKKAKKGGRTDAHTGIIPPQSWECLSKAHQNFSKTQLAV